jgi:hypothetical protein
LIQGSSNYLVVTVPSNLLTVSTGMVYRVTVTTSQGTGNGVGCKVYSYPPSVNTFSIRPEEVFLLQPPGTGMDTLVSAAASPLSTPSR